MAGLEEDRTVVTRWKRRHLPVWSARLDGALRIAYGALVVARRNSQPIGGPAGRDREGLEAGKPGDRRLVRAAGERDHEERPAAPRANGASRVVLDDQAPGHRRARCEGPRRKHQPSRHHLRRPRHRARETMSRSLAAAATPRRDQRERDDQSPHANMTPQVTFWFPTSAPPRREAAGETPPRLAAPRPLEER